MSYKAFPLFKNNTKTAALIQDNSLKAANPLLTAALTATPQNTSMYDIAISPNGQWLAEYSSTYCYITSLITGQVVQTITHGFSVGRTTLSWSRASDYLAIAGNPGVKIYNTSDWSLATTLRSAEYVHCAIFSPSVDELWVGGVTNYFGIFQYPGWGIRAGAEVPSYVYPVRWVEFSPDGSKVFTGSESLLQRGLVYNYPALAAAVTTITNTLIPYNVVRAAFSPDNTKLAINIAGAPRTSVFNAATGDKVTITEDTVATYGVAFTSDGTKMIVGKSGKIAVYDTTAWTYTHDTTYDGIGVRLSPVEVLYEVWGSVLDGDLLPMPGRVCLLSKETGLSIDSTTDTGAFSFVTPHATQAAILAYNTDYTANAAAVVTTTPDRRA